MFICKVSPEELSSMVCCNKLAQRLVEHSIAQKLSIETIQMKLWMLFWPSSMQKWQVMTPCFLAITFDTTEI